MNPKTALTRRQKSDIEEFLHLFADAEGWLKRRIGRIATDRTGVGALIDRYAEMNPLWADSANQLRQLAEIRNLLTHQRGLDEGYPVAVAPHSLRVIRGIVRELGHPETVSVRYRKAVTAVSPDDTLAAVLLLAFEHGFSQFPVLQGERFSGLITENEMVRWLGRWTRTATGPVDLAAVCVRAVLKEKDPFLQGVPIFCFAQLDAPVAEVMGRFSAERALEVVLLTASGRKDTPIEGIVTQWDAARYPL